MASGEGIRLCASIVVLAIPSNVGFSLGLNVRELETNKPTDTMAQYAIAFDLDTAQMRED